MICKFDSNWFWLEIVNENKKIISHPLPFSKRYSVYADKSSILITDYKTMRYVNFLFYQRDYSTVTVKGSIYKMSRLGDSFLAAFSNLNNEVYLLSIININHRINVPDVLFEIKNKNKISSI